MKYIYSALTLVLFILLVSFASKNLQPAEIHYYLGFVWQAPLSLMLLITFAFGVLIGIIAFFGIFVRQRRQLLGLQKELKQLNPNQGTQL